MGRQRELGSNPSTIDPTQNVKELVAAETRRQDDLRDAETRRVNQLARQKGVYEAKLSEKEAARLNAIRDIDVKAVYTASEKQEAAARVLANALATSAETLRALVATTALAAAESQTRFAAGIESRLGILEASRYEIKGQAGGTQEAEELARTNRRDKWGWIIATVMALIALATVVVPRLK